MSNVEIQIGGRTYKLSCAAGEEAGLRTAAAMLDKETQTVLEGEKGLTESKLLLFGALMLAERLNQANGTLEKEIERLRGAAGSDDEGMAELAERLEAIADRLEGG